MLGRTIVNVDLSGRTALITGGARGIGRVMASSFAQNGASVAVNDLLPEGNEVADELRRLGGTAAFYQADVSDDGAVKAMVDRVERELGEIDILVNNAGINVGKERHPIHEYLDSDWDRILRVNLFGTFYCSRAVSARMAARKRGTIINISSAFGVVPVRVQSAFATSKAGIIQLTRCHALEMGRYGVRVNAIAPGSILTEGTKTLFYNPSDKDLADSLLSHVALGCPGRPEDVASAALYLASDDASYVTGAVLVVDGGWTSGFARDW